MISTSTLSGQEPVILANEQNVKTSVVSDQQSEFAVIWHNLTYKVDSRPWYVRTKERLFKSNSSKSSSETGRYSAASDYSGSRQASYSEKIILNQVCGSAKSRELTAIMGPSGAGKSSLLHCLFQNRSAGTSGSILVSSSSIKNKLKVCFIPQSDYLNEWLTVREDLVFVSKLKLTKINTLFGNGTSDPSSTFEQGDMRNNTYVKQTGNECNTSLIDHEANALHVAELLGLDNCLDVKIKNISGGQKKRLSIARELMSKPDILVLDEPTTGLDSLTCYKTVSLLRDLAHLSPNSMAVVVTIHQPQREVFNLFDKTYFLSKTGRAIYEDNPKNAIETITRVANLTLPQPKYNPASFLIEIGSHELQSDSVDELAAYHNAKFYETFDKSYLRHLKHEKEGQNSNPNWKFCTFDQRHSIYSDSSFAMQSRTTTPQCKSLVSSEEDKLESNSTKVSPIEEPQLAACSERYFISYQLSNCLSSHSNNILQSFRHVFILTHRSWLSIIRNPTFTKSRLTFHTLLPLMMLMVFGTQTGHPNTCPKLDAQLDLDDLTKNLDGGSVSKNVEETRLGIENMCFFFILMYGFGINIISCTASFFPLTMRMFKKETINGLYSPAPYFIGQMLAELPLEIIYPTISVVLSYQLTGQLPSFLGWRMISISYVMFLVSYCIHSIGLLCGSIFVNNVSVAVIAGQVALFPSILLSGFMIRPSRMPEWLNTFSRLTSAFRAGLTGIMVSRYGFDVCECDEDSLPEAGGDIKFNAMTPQVRHVLEYLFPKNDTLSATDGTELDVTMILDKLSQQFIKAQTFGLDIKTCDQVKPYVMEVFDASDSDLFLCIGILILNIIIFKMITFSIMKSFPYRIT